MNQVSTSPSRQWMVVAGEHGDEPAPRVAKRPILLAVARRGLPKIVEASVIPAVLFFVVVSTIGTVAAMVAVLAWAYGSILRRLLCNDRVPGLLVLATVGLTVKTSIGILSGSTFAYFVQPVATTLALAMVFVGSVLIGRPLIARIANDFCPIAPELEVRPAVTRLFAGLTLLWAGVHVLTAATTIGLLVSLPVATFVAVKLVTGLTISAVAVVITVTWALRTAHSEQLVVAGL